MGVCLFVFVFLVGRGRVCRLSSPLLNNSLGMVLLLVFVFVVLGDESAAMCGLRFARFGVSLIVSRL